jgi:hypothetical protein
MNIGVIHDIKHLPRLEHIEELLKQGITHWTNFPAIYASPTYVGIMQAHKNAVKTLFETPQADGSLPDRVCVFEDDILFTSKDSFKKFIDQTPQDFDIYLGGYSMQFGMKPLPGGISKLNEFAGMHCYILHRKALNRFLALPTGKHIDRSCKVLDIYTCYPVIALWQNNKHSYRRGKVTDHSTIIANIPQYK